MDFQSNFNDVTDFTREKIESIRAAIDELNVDLKNDRKQRILLCHLICVPALLCMAYTMGRLVQKRKDARKMKKTAMKQCEEE